MKRLLLASAALLALSAPASAYTIDILAVFDRANPAFNDSSMPGLAAYNTGVSANTRINGSGADIGANISYSSVDGNVGAGGAQSGLFVGNIPPATINLEASPYGNGNSTRGYLSAGGLGGVVSLTRNTGAVTDLAMLWGTVDFGTTRNVLHTLGGMGGDTITGEDIKLACAAEGFACVDGQTEVFLTINGLKSFTSATFSDYGSNSFEFNVRAIEAVPEASTWAMMILGFLGVGVMSMRKKFGSFRLA
jgi:hypothetical protein